MRRSGGTRRLPLLWWLSRADMGHFLFNSAVPLRLFSSAPPLSRRQHLRWCNGTVSLFSAGAMRCLGRGASSRSATPSPQSITPTGGAEAGSRQQQALMSSSCSSAQHTETPREVAASGVMETSRATVRNPFAAVASESTAAVKRCTRSGERLSDASHTGQVLPAASIGKSKHKPRSDLRVKRKAPWGAQQLRDSWSEDAMSKRDRENMDERIHREYRYHPDEFRRHYIRYTAMLTFPCVMLGMSVTYYYETGRPFWQADPQYLLNLLRVMDTSPRSKLYAHRLPETHELPVHVLRHRSENAGKREYEEHVFRLTHSAFERPSADVLRLLELEALAKASETAPEVAALAESATALK
ncbi:hypothetical protein CUR178_05468 [Leishmania enriettii]|uniref:Transmembrane protein n=1 Tax=Leishmania enriettii TaxID=5663 RepID=A0A836GBG9_LEIEN|nr:hypothetical protein CUR178_05468 [Leishmania enriettii]